MDGRTRLQVFHNSSDRLGKFRRIPIVSGAIQEEAPEVHTTGVVSGEAVQLRHHHWDIFSLHCLQTLNLRTFYHRCQSFLASVLQILRDTVLLLVVFPTRKTVPSNKRFEFSGRAENTAHYLEESP